MLTLAKKLIPSKITLSVFMAWFSYEFLFKKIAKGQGAVDVSRINKLSNLNWDSERIIHDEAYIYLNYALQFGKEYADFLVTYFDQSRFGILCHPTAKIVEQENSNRAGAQTAHIYTEIFKNTKNSLIMRHYIKLKNVISRNMGESLFRITNTIVHIKGKKFRILHKVAVHTSYKNDSKLEKKLKYGKFDFNVLLKTVGGFISTDSSKKRPEDIIENYEKHRKKLEDHLYNYKIFTCQQPLLNEVIELPGNNIVLSRELETILKKPMNVNLKVLLNNIFNKKILKKILINSCETSMKKEDRGKVILLEILSNITKIKNVLGKKILTKILVSFYKNAMRDKNHGKAIMLEILSDMTSFKIVYKDFIHNSERGIFALSILKVIDDDYLKKYRLIKDALNETYRYFCKKIKYFMNNKEYFYKKRDSIENIIDYMKNFEYIYRIELKSDTLEQVVYNEIIPINNLYFITSHLISFVKHFMKNFQYVDFYRKITDMMLGNIRVFKEFVNAYKDEEKSLWIVNSLIKIYANNPCRSNSLHVTNFINATYLLHKFAEADVSENTCIAYVKERDLININSYGPTKLCAQLDLHVFAKMLTICLEVGTSASIRAFIVFKNSKKYADNIIENIFSDKDSICRLVKFQKQNNLFACIMQLAKIWLGLNGWSLFRERFFKTKPRYKEGKYDIIVKVIKKFESLQNKPNYSIQ
jgi:hypothetical protein